MSQFPHPYTCTDMPRFAESNCIGRFDRAHLHVYAHIHSPARTSPPGRPTASPAGRQSTNITKGHCRRQTPPRRASTGHCLSIV